MILHNLILPKAETDASHPALARGVKSWTTRQPVTACAALPPVGKGARCAAADVAAYLNNRIEAVISQSER